MDELEPERSCASPPPLEPSRPASSDVPQRHIFSYNNSKENIAFGLMNVNQNSMS